MRTWLLWVIVGVLARSAWSEGLPEIKSRAYVVIDAETGAEISSNNADEVRPIASTTKIFVAMAVRESRLDLDGWTEITSVDARQARGGARTRLDVGQQFRNRDLLRAMLIASDNRAPTALGRGAGMNPDQLVAAMNGVAKRLHLVRTKFTDPTGLRGNVSTAREMALALRAALADDELRAIMAESYDEVVAKGHSRGIGYGTTNQPLVARRYDVIAGKTGFTEAAGYCYIAAARFAGKVIVTAFLGADGRLTRFGDFNRVAAWLERGAPGAKLHAAAHVRPAPTVEVEIRGSVPK